MPDPDSSNPPTHASLDTAGPQLTEAFELLSNDTRLSILLALWELFEPGPTEQTVSFSELYDAVEMTDSGNFTYHLDKLTGQYVTKTDAGYKLTAAGLKIVRAVIAGSGFEDARVPPTTVDYPCPRCGAPEIQIRYHDGALYTTCRSCSGFGDTAETPAGTVASWEFDQAGLVDREPEELRAAGGITGRHVLRMMREGVCSECSGVTEESLRLCEEHVPGSDGSCPNCDSPDSVRVWYVCTVCKYCIRAPVEMIMLYHPAVLSFYYDHGVDTRLKGGDPEDHDEVVRLFAASSHTLVSTDPIRIRVSVPCHGDELVLTVDDALEVTDISGPSS